ncbi:NAD-dependent epimerase/dehydratase family protein [Marinomonas lutimaris]|uniref:NAD-dependent epimerase/dehydratase family protein n=1 Tax=Marinomonas lutimaris TaxID=2846746 RepID=UPI002017CF49|nr:NAD-dependent epimerase/dehydratase family protein [Marinomonas lutimaris]
MIFSNLKVAVTGGNGFIGSVLISNLKNDYDITSISRQVLNGEEVCDIDCFIHLAGLAHTENAGLKDYIESDLILADCVSSMCIELGIKRFIYISTVQVLGLATSETEFLTPFSEEKPSTVQAQAKLMVEKKLESSFRGTQTELVIIRAPLVYGEGVKANFASLMKLVGKGFPLPFRAIKQNKRSLVSVYNLVDLIKVCIDHPKAANQVFLVSDDDDMSTARMVALMAKAQGKANLSLPVPVWCFKLAGKLFKKEAVVDRLVGSLQLDIDHTKNTLDWAPPYSVEYGFALAAKKKD